jgi:hypothetical protein
MTHDEILKKAIIAYNKDELPKAGSGSSRIVYHVGKEYVLKVTRYAPEYNRDEYNNYQYALQNGNAHKFAASYAISADGTFLLSEKVDDCFRNDHYERADWIEAKNAGLFELFSDHWMFNIGRRFSDSELVIIDYSM